MKKVMVGLLCFMLAAGALAGCGSKKPEPDGSRKDTAEENGNQEENKADASDNEKQEEAAKGTEEKTDKETDGEQQNQDADKEENSETDGKDSQKNMEEDLTMTVLKDQAGTRDYTSLEELSPEPGCRIAVVVKNTKTGFWTTVKKGMEAAVKNLNEKMGYKGEDKIKLSFEGPSDETDVESQINIIDAVLSENPSVLCLAAIDTESCEAQLEMAAENDIPVVVLDSGVESELVNAVCATDNYTAGAEAAKKLAEAIGNEGQVAVMTHVATSKSSQDREKGFTEELAKNYPNIEVVNTSHENEETSMSEMAEAVLKLYPQVKGYYCTNETAANDVLDAVNSSGKEVVVVGFDAGKKQMEAIKKGTELGTFAQNPYGMGYATVVAAVRADLQLENDAFINTGYQWIDSSKLELPEYANYLYE